MSIDAEKMYPSVKFEQIKRAVNYFLRDAPASDRLKAQRCLEMVKYGMDNTYVAFQDQYWIYGGHLPVEEKGLTIGGYESAFFADLVAAYILENAKDIFSNSLFNKIYRDDGIDIKNSILSIDQVCDWLETFQNRVNELTGSEYLKFTAVVWDPNCPPDVTPQEQES